jgi:gamma-glutamylcyclotransferase (GGCT)/AIG2-like uncharacterized protein YtfP
MSSMDVLDCIAKVGPLLSGVGVIAGTGIAGLSYLNFSRRTLYANWIERYGKIHAEFWNDAGIAETRACIEYHRQYDEISKIISKLMSNRSTLEYGDLTESEEKKLEKLDRFCALISRMYLLEDDATTPKQRSLWRDIGGVYFITRMQIPERMAFKRYIEEFWPDLNKKISYNLFVYGTLTDPDTLSKELGIPRSAKSGRLDGYELRRGQWPYVVEKPGASVPGQIILGLTARDFDKLDHYENDYEDEFPQLRDGRKRCLYLRRLKPIQIFGKSGKSEQCWVYLPNLPDWLPEWRLDERTDVEGGRAPL